KCLSNAFDGQSNTYWQSEGPQPHKIDAQFMKRMPFSILAIYTDYKVDESYTPKKISIKAGNSVTSLKKFEDIELSDPNGWIIIPLYDKKRCEDEISASNGNFSIQSPSNLLEFPLCSFHFRLEIISNHQGGRDAHIRQIKLFANNKLMKEWENDQNESNSFSTSSFFMMNNTSQLR
ncbi:MAG: Anaphase-promoting complex subunit 10, partial [Paramarteilia canceri]